MDDGVCAKNIPATLSNQHCLQRSIGTCQACSPVGADCCLYRTPGKEMGRVSSLENSIHAFHSKVSAGICCRNLYRPFVDRDEYGWLYRIRYSCCEIRPQEAISVHDNETSVNASER